VAPGRGTGPASHPSHPSMKRSLAILAVGLLVAGCAGPATPSPSSRPLSRPELLLRVLDALRERVFFCGPPVVMVPTRERFLREVSALRRSDPSTYRAILRHEDLRGPPRTEPDLARVDRMFQQLLAIRLGPADGGDSFRAYVAGPRGSPHRLVSGTVTTTGQVTIERSVATAGPACPICLARGVAIATPSGPVQVQDVRAGRAVWSTDRSGRRIRATVLRTRRRRASGPILRIVLADGRTVVVSPGHPTANGRLLGWLHVGDGLAGSRVSSVTSIPYRGFTYDLLPSGPTGDYLADGVLLGSTLSR